MSRQPKKRRACQRRRDHTDYRKKVTLADFYDRRLNALAIPYGSIEAAYLMGMPAHRPNRAKISEFVRCNSKQLISRCRKFLSLSPVFQRPNPLQVHERPVPSYADWLRIATGNHTAAERYWWEHCLK